MHGKNSFRKTMRQVRSAQVRTNSRVGAYFEVGRWRFQENDDGDLVIVNKDTNHVVTLIQK